MQITQSQADEISCLNEGETCEEFTHVETGPWQVHRKYQTRYVIVLHNGTYYKARESRSAQNGDWFYELNLDLVPVEKVQIISHEWRTL